MTETPETSEHPEDPGGPGGPEGHEGPEAPEAPERSDRAPARTPTAEFRIPDFSKTRPDIAVRRPAPAPPAPSATRVDPLPVPVPAEDAADPEPAEEEAADPEVTEDAAPDEPPQPDEPDDEASVEAPPSEASRPTDANGGEPAGGTARPSEAPPQNGPAAPVRSAPPQPQVPSGGPGTYPVAQPNVSAFRENTADGAWRGTSGSGAAPGFVGHEQAADVTWRDVPQSAAAEPAGEPAGEPRGRRAWPWVLVAALVLVMAVVTAQLMRPVPEPELRLTIAAEHTFPGTAPRLPWPGTGQSAVYVEGLGMMGTTGSSRPAPTASVAKVMTAYVYLKAHPLRPGEPGPVLAVSDEGAAQIPMRRGRGESLLGITKGQRLTQRKALEALLIISANDVAHELAKWDAGSVPAFVAKMNAAARELGMTNTTYTDPSGLDEATVSTAADQVRLLRAAMKLPAFAEIVDQRTYVPANGGPVRQGGNFLLGRFGVVGGKTGYTSAAGGNFVFAARKKIDGVATLIVGAVMGQESPSAAGAVSAAGTLVQAAGRALTSAKVAKAGAEVAVVEDGLGGTTPVVAASAVTVVGWAGLTVRVAAVGDPPAEGADGERTGTLTAGAARVPLELGSPHDGPSITDRLVRLG